jgi:hypothetical protein
MSCGIKSSQDKTCPSSGGTYNTGRKSERDIPRQVWFVHEDNTLFLLPNHGSDINWYKNFRANQTLKISVSGEEIPAARGIHNNESCMT